MDGDAFFVACEIAKNPKLKGLPVVTGEERGIVSALSYEAKALGITRGMPIFKLKKQFPKVLILPGDYKSYAKYSGAMFDIVRRYADDVEEYSIDECFADLTGLDKPLYMTHKEIAEQIKDEITTELGLSVSIGVAPTKVLAKVASKWQKPNGLTVITKETAKKFLEKVSIGSVWGIGKQTTEFLRNRGVETALAFLEKDIEWLRENLSSPYEALWLELGGVSVMKIDPNPKTVYSSVQKTRTFHPATNDKKFLLSQLSKHVEDACKKIRHYNLIAKQFSFFLKTKEFTYHSFSVPIPISTNSPEPLIALIKAYFDKVCHPEYLYRTTGVNLYDLGPEGLAQRDLFDDFKEEIRFNTIHKQIDLLEDKFGKRIMYLGSTHDALQRKEKGTELNDPNRNLLFL